MMQLIQDCQRELAAQNKKYNDLTEHFEYHTKLWQDKQAKWNSDKEELLKQIDMLKSVQESIAVENEQTAALPWKVSLKMKREEEDKKRNQDQAKLEAEEEKKKWKEEKRKELKKQLEDDASQTYARLRQEWEAERSKKEEEWSNQLKALNAKVAAVKKDCLEITEDRHQDLADAVLKMKTEMQAEIESTFDIQARSHASATGTAIASVQGNLTNQITQLSKSLGQLENKLNAVMEVKSIGNVSSPSSASASNSTSNIELVSLESRISAQEIENTLRKSKDVKREDLLTANQNALQKLMIKMSMLDDSSSLHEQNINQIRGEIDSIWTVIDPKKKWVISGSSSESTNAAPVSSPRS
jgi:hypothetical protein